MDSWSSIDFKKKTKRKVLDKLSSMGVIRLELHSLSIFNLYELFHNIDPGETGMIATEGLGGKRKGDSLT